jgi:kynurenine 3-monooxygenase
MMIVVGAGLVGPLWACLLVRRGYQVAIYEKRSDPREAAAPQGRSTHLVISHRGWKALEAVGLREEVRRMTLPLGGRSIHAQEGTVAFQPYGEGSQAIYAIRRELLNRMLIDLCRTTPGITLHFNQRCLAADPHTGTLLFEHTLTGERSEVRGERTFAADGAFSLVRASLMRQEYFNYSQEYLPYGYKEFTLPAESSGHMDSISMHTWPRKQLSLFAFPNQDGTFTATLVGPVEGNLSLTQLRTPEELVRLFQERFPDVPPEPIVYQYFRNPISSLVTIRCAPWTHGERIILLGDAAHAMVPFLGQGMNAGFEDCTVLDSLMERHGEDWSTVLREYERLRKPDCDAVTEMSLRNFTELTELVGNPRFLLQKKLEHKIHRLYPDRFIPLYMMVAFTHIPYSQILQIAAAQEAITRELMALPDIETRWDGPEVEARLHELMRGVTRRPLAA